MFGDYPLNIDVLLLTISMFGDYPLNIDVLLLTISMFGDDQSPKMEIVSKRTSIFSG
jgi:hypothetical protein